MVGEMLSVKDATAVVKAQETRLREIVASWRLAFTQRPQSIIPCYDTLVIDVTIPSHCVGECVSVEKVIREVLLVLHALSGCRGFSFRDNAAFWISVLLQAHPARYSRFEIPPPNRSFLRVVLSCNYHESDSFQREVFDIFHPDSMGRLSQSTQDVLARLQAYRSGVPVEPIECVVRLQLARTGNDTKDMLAYATSQLRSIDEAQQRSVIQLTALELVGRRRSSRPCQNFIVIHLKPLQTLCAKLPRSMSLALRFSHYISATTYVNKFASENTVQTPELGSFLKRACGFRGSEFTGRLEVLDLVSAFNRPIKSSTLARLDFAALCTLLPYSRGLREVRVTITDTDDLLWLAYAMFHPQSHHSTWRSLVLCFDFSYRGSPIYWQAVDQFVQAGAKLTDLVSLLDSNTSTDNDASQEQSTGQRPLLTRRTATTTKRTTVFKANKIGELTTLARGETVEICDSAAAVMVTTFNPRDSIAVAVPGYGIGYTAKSCLSPVTETEESDPPTSCVTSLYVAGLEIYYPDIRPHDELGILRLFGPSLKVLRVSQKNWFQQRGFSQYLPQLETLDGCRIFVNTCLADFVALPKLRALGLECCYLRVEKCFSDLLIPCAGKLQELRASLHMSVDHIPRVEALLRECLGRLAHIKLDIKMNPYNEGVDRIVTMGDVSTSAGRSKLTFLGVIHDIQTRCRGEYVAALAQLDSNLIRIVFDFCGQELESLVIRCAHESNWESPVPHEMETDGDAWSDEFADE